LLNNRTFGAYIGYARLRILQRKLISTPFRRSQNPAKPRLRNPETRANEAEMIDHLQMAREFLAKSKPHQASLHLRLAREMGQGSLACVLPMRGSSSAQQYYWRKYDRLVRKTRGDAEFRRLGYKIGHLSERIATEMRHVMMTAPIVCFSSAEQVNGFVGHAYDEGFDKSINHQSQFRRLDPAGEALLEKALAELRNEVASCLGSPWRIVAVKSWTTPPSNSAAYMYGWHGDEFPEELFKIMIYWGPMSRETGGLEIYSKGKEIFVQSSSHGTWVLFRNSDLLHRGVPGNKGVRAATEVTICRASTFDLRLRFPGVVPDYPVFPWIDALELDCNPICESRSADRGPARFSLKSRLVSVINRFGQDRRLFKLRRKAQRFKRLYLSAHPQ
jgi:hypothetical protein